MTSKVLVKMPEVPFSQVNNVKKVSGDLMAPVSAGGELRSVGQLQDNIRFLQTKHQIMLNSLHDEVDSLRQKNRELQFQLVFSKIISDEIATTPETDEQSRPEGDRSDKNYKKRCVQLEKELCNTKAALEASLARTAALQALLQQHKIQEVPRVPQQCGYAASYSEARGRPDNSGDHEKEAARLQLRLDEAERLVKRLRAETDEQRRELQSIKASLSAGGRGRGGGNHRSSGPLHQRFPPLQSLPFWQQQQQQSQQRENGEYHGWGRGNRRNNDRNDAGARMIGLPSPLPDVRGNNSQLVFNDSNSGGQNQNQNQNQNHQNQNQNQNRRGTNHSYNNHYYRNSERGRGNESRSYREEDQQNNSQETCEGDGGETSNENNRNNTHKNKRGQNKS